jgi:aminoglycoside/choline kinase family phosphotransferase
MPGLTEWVERETRASIASLEPLPPAAGRRRYFRVTLSSGETRIVMHALPEDPAILPPALRRDDLPFIEVTEFLARFGIPVPEIGSVDREHRWILLEDLGGVHLCDLSGEGLAERLREAATLLARVHAIPTERFPFDRPFDEEWIGFELRYFVDHGVPLGLRAETGTAIRVLVERVASLPRTLCLRDYQSQNLMIDPADRLRVLDYQDALLAPRELDLASFLYDSYLEMEEDLRSTLLEAYETAAEIRISESALAMLVLQRKCKDVARFHHLVEVRGDDRYVRARGRARRAALNALTRAVAVLGDAGPVLHRALEAGPA